MNKMVLADRMGFEPMALEESPVFKTGSLNRSDTSPGLAGFLVSLKPAKHLSTQVQSVAIG